MSREYLWGFQCHPNQRRRFNLEPIGYSSRGFVLHSHMTLGVYPRVSCGCRPSYLGWPGGPVCSVVEHSEGCLRFGVSPCLSHFLTMQGSGFRQSSCGGACHMPLRPVASFVGCFGEAPPLRLWPSGGGCDFDRIPPRAARSHAGLPAEWLLLGPCPHVG